MTYHPIHSQSDIDLFLDRTNGLHDAYLIGVDYADKGFVLWTDDLEFRESGSYVIAQAMKWRFL